MSSDRIQINGNVGSSADSNTLGLGSNSPVQSQALYNNSIGISPINLRINDNGFDSSLQQDTFQSKRNSHNAIIIDSQSSLSGDATSSTLTSPPPSASKSGTVPYTPMREDSSLVRFVSLQF